MKSKYLFCAVIALISLFLVVSISSAEEATLPTKGILCEFGREIDRISQSEVIITETRGVPVTANLKLKEQTLSGNLKIKGEKYSLLSVEQFQVTDNIMGYKGNVKNSEHQFEAFIPQKADANMVTINIFKEDGEGNRIDASTIRLDESDVKTVSKKLTAPVSVVEDVYGVSSAHNIRVLSSDFDTIGYKSKDGIKFKVQGYEDRTDDTPWVVRVWTDVDDVIDEAEQSSSAITRINILRSYIENDGPSKSTFESVHPDDNKDKSFSVPFTVSGRTIKIPVKISSVDVDDPGFSNPQSVKYYWTFKKAKYYEKGEDDEGILSQHTFFFNDDTPRNKYGYIVVDVNCWNQYEVVGNYREYLKFRASEDVWYEPK
ncbi:hypothetical protein ABDB91_14955 [Desulfoscipio sp. XC116]|uniref:hypothetical protein n=1 Tax=Desulfoscipio sp. XC116 TaxID=3144975 RepID=UPI00325BFA35